VFGWLVQDRQRVLANFGDFIARFNLSIPKHFIKGLMSSPKHIYHNQNENLFLEKSK
jgi:hypothetical protein